MKVVFDIKSVSPGKGDQYNKVFIYYDGEFQEYLWMSWDDLRMNKAESEGRGNEVEIKKSYKETE